MGKRTLVWFRGKDLRLSDHDPLRAALAEGDVIPLFVIDPYFFEASRAAALPHRMQFLLESLCELEQALRERGSELVVLAGKSVDVVPRLVREWRVDRVVAHRWVEPFARERDRRVSEAVDGALSLYEGETLLPPGLIRTEADRPYSVWSQFARAFRKAARIPKPVPAPERLPPLPKDIHAQRVPIPTLESLGLKRNPALCAGGERAAQERLRRFLQVAARNYTTNRDRMDLPGTSRLSADLKFGTLSVRTVWTSVVDGLGEASVPYTNELLWREFAHSTLFARPYLLERPFRPEFGQFPWENDETSWDAWAAGQTGYPVVDAAARQLLFEGFVHNRARMIAASFLTKHLLVDYRRGEAHYMKYLTDGDWSQNNFNWQWSAGSGCDAQPYFRIFNPVLQGEKFDPEGKYVRRWVPELEQMPQKWIHQPWNAPPEVLRAAGVALGRDYPRPIVPHDASRKRFLALAKSLKHAAS